MRNIKSMALYATANSLKTGAEKQIEAKGSILIWFGRPKAPKSLLK